jgi:hypothetical protein
MALRESSRLEMDRFPIWSDGIPNVLLSYGEIFWVRYRGVAFFGAEYLLVLSIDNTHARHTKKS